MPTPPTPPRAARPSLHAGRPRRAPWLSWTGRLGTLHLALGLSLAAHAALLSFRFIDPERFNRLFQEQALEVILVNARAPEAPTQAQAMAQANMAGGGDAAAGRATSPLPASAEVELGDAAQSARRHVEQLQDQQRQLLAQVHRDMATLPSPDPQRDAGAPTEEAQEDRQRRLLKLLAEIEKRVNDENARPRKRYISPATREVVYAVYYDQLRRRIEERGTRDFPEHRGSRLYGELTMNITVEAGGRVIDTEVVLSSGSKLLDQRATAIVQATSPFGLFGAEMLRQADQIVVTSRFRFTRQDALETSLSAQPGATP